MAHHGGARDLAESADMRQARRPIAGREQPLVLRLLLKPRDNLLRLFERPGIRLLGERAQIARTGGKVDREHKKGSPGPRKLTVSAYKCKMAAQPKDIAVIASQWVGARRRPMTGCTKQSTGQQSKCGLLRRCAPRNHESAAFRTLSHKTGSRKNSAPTNRCSGPFPNPETAPSSAPAVTGRCPCARRCRYPRRNSGSRQTGRR